MALLSSVGTLSLPWRGVFRIARAQATGFSSPAMASVMGGVERCQALQPQVPAMHLSPLILEKTFLEFQCCTTLRAWIPCSCGFVTISTEACMIQTSLGIKSLLIFLLWMEVKFNPVEMRSEEDGQGSRGKSRLLVCRGAWAGLMLAECRSLLGLAGALETKIFYPELRNAAACPDLNSLRFSGLRGIIFCLKY